jgi:hypothetical protein
MSKRYYYNKVLWLTGLISLWLVGCTSDEVEPGVEGKKSAPIQLVSYMTPYVDMATTPASEARGIALTRADWLPTGYSLDTDHNSIGLYFTQDSSPSDIIESRNVYYGEDDKWHLNQNVDPNTYLLYGYTPYNAASVNISKNTTFRNGAVMTISGLKTVMEKDLCVLVGATEGTSTSPVSYVEVTGLTPNVSSVTGLYILSGSIYTEIIDANAKAQSGTTYYERKDLAIGKFDCIIKEENETTKNYLYLLFDHLYAELDLQFRVDEKYAQLRTIRLKEIKATTYTDADFNTLETKPLKAVVTLQANNTGASPITSLTFEEDNTGSDQEQGLTIYENNNPTVSDNLPSGTENGKKIYSDKVAYLMSDAHRYIMLETMYNVYDTEGNLISENRKATNKINTRSIFKYVETLERGTKYQLKLTVAPTYLYVLSDPDLDNPTVVVN